MALLELILQAHLKRGVRYNRVKLTTYWLESGVAQVGLKLFVDVFPDEQATFFALVTILGHRIIFNFDDVVVCHLLTRYALIRFGFR